MTSKMRFSLLLPPPYLLKSLSDTALYFSITFLARRWSFSCTPALTALTTSFFTVRLIAHTLDHYSSNSYADRYTRLRIQCTKQLAIALSYCPRARFITYIASITLAYLHMPTSIALSVCCGVCLGLLNPI